jgi:hypothetical protein
MCFKYLYSTLFIGAIFILFSITQLHAQGDQNLYNDDHSKRFAEYLFETKQYSLAARELERIRFMNPEDVAIQKKMIDAYSLGGQSLFAVSRLRSLYPDTLNMPSSLANTYIKLIFSFAQYDRLLSFSASAAQLNQSDRVIWKGVYYYHKRQFKEASDALHPFSNLEEQKVQAFDQLFTNAGQLKRKSPFVAGLFSTLIPGTGKFYTKNWADGIMSMIFIGTAAWQSYRGFNQNGINSTYGWIFGTLGTGYYLGNIYGSQKAAKNYNQNLYQSLDDRLEVLINSNF